MTVIEYRFGKISCHSKRNTVHHMTGYVCLSSDKSLLRSKNALFFNDCVCVGLRKLKETRLKPNKKSKLTDVKSHDINK